MSDIQEILLTGLRNAHAMEKQALAIMRPQLSRIEHYPEVAERLEVHIEETEGQIGRLEQILEDMGEDRSVLKDMTLSVGGTLASLGHTMAPDEIVKNSFANFAFENYEIAAYKSLIALATQSGPSRMVEMLEQNLGEEQAMATWLDQNMEAVTLQYAALKEAGETAKR